MESKVVKIKEKELNGMELKGNYLYEENGELYFTDRLNHCLFVLEKDYKNYEETKAMTFDQYVTKFLEVCAKVKNKPSLLFLNYVPKNFLSILNKPKRNYKVLDLEGEYLEENIKTVSATPTISCVNTDFITVLKKLVETRSDEVPQNDVFVFFNEPEYSHNLKSPSLDTVVTVARSRKIHFVFNFVNKAKYIANYNPESYQIIENNCQTKFICNYDGAVDIQP